MKLLKCWKKLQQPKSQEAIRPQFPSAADQLLLWEILHIIRKHIIEVQVRVSLIRRQAYWYTVQPERAELNIYSASGERWDFTYSAGRSFVQVVTIDGSVWQDHWLNPQHVSEILDLLQLAVFKDLIHQKKIFQVQEQTSEIIDHMRCMHDNYAYDYQDAAKQLLQQIHNRQASNFLLHST